MDFNLSDERKRELLSKLEKARLQYKRAFKHDLTDKDVLYLLEEHIRQDKIRLFLKEVGVISPADVDFLQTVFDLPKLKVGLQGDVNVGTAREHAQGLQSEEHAPEPTKAEAPTKGPVAGNPSGQKVGGRGRPVAGGNIGSSGKQEEAGESEASASD